MLRLTGFSPERFFNLCRTKEIGIWEISAHGREYRFFMTVRDFKRVRPLVRKCRVRLRILGRYGLPFFLHRNRKRKLYAAGIAAFFLVLFVMSRFIWNIALEGNRRFTDDMLLHYLDSQEIRYGIRKSLVDCDRLEEEIRSDYPDILWVSARISGTRLMIKIKENDVVGKVPEQEHGPRDLVAEKDGVITRMVVREGRACVAPGDEVAAGDLLVAGALPLLDDFGTLITTNYVRADADIYARAWETCRETVPRMVTQRTKTGRLRHGLRLRLGGLQFLWMLPEYGQNEWEITGESRQATVFGDFYLPVWVDRICAAEYQSYERQRTPEELLAAREQILQEKMEIFVEKGLPIIQNDVTILEKRLSYEVQCRFLVEEPVGIGRNISQAEESRQPDERGGNNH